MIVPVPIALALMGAIFWPVTLSFAVGLAVLGFALPGRWTRIACLVLAVVLGADCLLAIWLPAD